MTAPHTLIIILGKRVKSVETILNGAFNYLSTIKDTVNSIDPNEYNTCIKAIDNTRLLLPLVTAKGEEPATTAKLYETINAIDTDLLLLKNVLENETYSKLALRGASSTYTGNALRNRNLALSSYESYIESSIDDDETIITTALEASRESINSVLKFIFNNEAIVNKFTIRLIGMTIRLTRGEQRRRLEEILEKQKDAVLDAGVIKINGAGVHGLIVRHGLIPLTESMPLSALFVVLGLKHKIGVSDFNNIEQCGSGVLVIDISNGSPIDFDMRGLIDADYLEEKGLKTNPLSGLTKKILQRFNTTRVLEKGGHASQLRLFKPENPKNWYILQTINGLSFRVMGLSSTPYCVSRDLVDSIMRGLSLRAHRYNLLQEEEIIGNCFDTQATYLLDQYVREKSTVRSSNQEKNTICEKYMEWFENRAAANAPKNFSELKAMSVDRDSLRVIVVSGLARTVSARGRGTDEYLVSYLGKFEQVAITFARELERQWESEPESNREFTELGKVDLTRFILDIANNVVRRAVDSLDSVGAWTGHDLTLKEFFLDKKLVA